MHFSSTLAQREYSRDLKFNTDAFRGEVRPCRRSRHGEARLCTQRNALSGSPLISVRAFLGDDSFEGASQNEHVLHR